jgi:hypothetical protein
MDTTTDAAETAREVRLRRAGERQGLRLHKSRTRDPLAVGYGLFHLTDMQNRLVAGGDLAGHSMSIDDVEVYLAAAEDFAVYFGDTHGVYADDERPILEWHDSYPTATKRDVGAWDAQGWLLTARSDSPRERFLLWGGHELAHAARAARLTLAAWANDDREEAAE